jgi:hypothetical protein
LIIGKVFKGIFYVINKNSNFKEERIKNKANLVDECVCLPVNNQNNEFIIVLLTNRKQHQSLTRILGKT